MEPCEHCGLRVKDCERFKGMMPCKKEPSALPTNSTNDQNEIIKTAPEAHRQIVIDRLTDEVSGLRRAIAELELYFTSGNAVPVERATIRAEDFWRIVDV